MNCKEHHLPELELATGQVREALQAILYTILLYVSEFALLVPVCDTNVLTTLFFFFLICSIRSPGPVTPRDVQCEGFDLTYPRIASDKMSATPSAHSSLAFDVDKKVDDAIGSFLLTLSQIGPELLCVSDVLVEMHMDQFLCPGQKSLTNPNSSIKFKIGRVA